jgi:tetratricopeptide (TPR) repeat protein
MISWLKELLAKPDPALSYNNGELRFWLGWAQEVAGDHAAAQESWRKSRTELEPFLKEQPDNYVLIGDLALVSMGLGDKPAALALSEQAMTVLPLEKDVVDGPAPIEVLARVAAQLGEPDRAIAALQKLLSIPSEGRTSFARAAHSCSASVRSNVRSAPERSALPGIDSRTSLKISLSNEMKITVQPVGGSRR